MDILLLRCYTRFTCSQKKVKLAAGWNIDTPYPSFYLHLLPFYWMKELAMIEVHIRKTNWKQFSPVRISTYILYPLQKSNQIMFVYSRAINKYHFLLSPSNLSLIIISQINHLRINLELNLSFQTLYLITHIQIIFNNLFCNQNKHIINNYIPFLLNISWSKTLNLFEMKEYEERFPPPN